MDHLPLFDATIDGEHVEFLALTTDSTIDDVLELDFVRECIRLRASDVEAFERVWELVGMFLERGVPMDAISG